MDEHIAKCKVCGKRFEQLDGEEECSYVCRVKRRYAMEELKGLIRGSQEISKKMLVIVQDYEDGNLTKYYAMREVDLLSRELACLASTIKMVGYEVTHPKLVCK